MSWKTISNPSNFTCTKLQICDHHFQNLQLTLSKSKSNSTEMAIPHCSIRPAIKFASSALLRHACRLDYLYGPRTTALRRPILAVPRIRAFSTDVTEAVVSSGVEMPSVCTADELHYVTVNNSDWRLALWRYHPSPQAPRRNHPLLLLSGVGTNAIGYDLSPEASFARYMCEQGYDTWILEVRGAGLSMRGAEKKNVEKSAQVKSEQMEAAMENMNNGSIPVEQQVPMALRDTDKPETDDVNKESTGLASKDESRLVAELTETFTIMSERLSGFLTDSQSKSISTKLFDQISKLLGGSFISESFSEIRGKLLSLLETKQNSGVAAQIKDLSKKLVDIIDEGQRSVSPQLFDLHDRLISTVVDFQNQLDLIVTYDWDFDHYLEEDVPAVMEYIKAQTNPKDGRLLAIGHSMGGILLYAMLSKYSLEGKDTGLAAIVTLASSLDYTSSKSTLRLLLPLADPAQVLNVPAIPLGALLSAAYPLSSQPPYVLSWLNEHITAQDMMHPELLKKLVLNNFCTIPAKLLLQLTTAFREGGLRNRTGELFYKDHIHKIDVPVLALAGDRDLICPPEAVQDTVKLIPEHLVTYKVFGQPDGPHYAHYDLVGGRVAVDELYPCIIEFLSKHDVDYQSET